MEISSPSTLSRRHFLAYSARLLGTALGAGSLFSACGSGTEPLLTIMVNMPSHYLTEFQKRYPSLRILQQPENRTKLITSLMGRVGIGVFEYVDEDVPVFAHEGVLADLSSYSAKDPILPPSNLLPVNDAYRWNGTVLGQGPRYALARATINSHRRCHVSSITNLAGTPALRKRTTGKCGLVLRSVKDIVGDRSPLPVGHEQRHSCSAEDKSSRARRNTTRIDPILLDRMW